MHTRFQPRIHAFRYCLFYFGIPLEGQSKFWGLFARNSRWGIFSVWDRDYLDASGDELQVKLRRHLKHLGWNQSNGKELDNFHVELVTTPRVFGYSFNPLSVYFIREQADSLEYCAVLLEVNNTFGEKHLYLCHAANSLKENVYRIGRSFHVSPFNNRSGIYEAEILGTNSAINITLKMYDYSPCPNESDSDVDVDERSRKKLHFIANVNGKSFALDWYSFGYLILCYPFNALFTVPRIMYQAFLLTYQKKLPIYPRPNPGTVGDGKTIVRIPMSKYQRLCLDNVMQFFSPRMKGLFTFKYDQEIISPGKDIFDNDNCVITVNSPMFFTRLATSDNVIYACYLSFVKNEFSCSKEALLKFLSCFGSDCLKRHIYKHERFTIERPFSLILWLGSLKDTLEMFLFKWTTPFVKNCEPYLLEQRCQTYLENSCDDNDCGDNGWDGLSLQSDSLGPLKLEKQRASLFKSVAFA